MQFFRPALPLGFNWWRWRESNPRPKNLQK
jgi:hypothetical protein